MTNEAAVPTRHKEYSLGLALLAAVVIFFLNGASSLTGLVCVNALATVSILFSASSVVRHADVLAHRFGEPFGSLILSLAIVVLEVGLISILMLSGSASQSLMRDTIYSVVIIVMTGFIGFSLLLGGYRYETQSFTLAGIKHYLIAIIPLSLIILVLPACMDSRAFNSGQLVVVAITCIAMYAVFLHVQTVTHQDFFIYEEEDGDEGHGHPSSHTSARHFAYLLVHLVAVMGITKLNSLSLYSLLNLFDAPPAVAGFLVALLILSPEGVGAFRSVWHNRVQRTMNLFLGSVLATISVTVPVVIVVAMLTGQTLEMGLAFPDILLLFATFLVCQTSLTGGETNMHSGVAHVVLFLVYLMLLFR